jgi:SAM-dependent methyltransferase
MNASSIRTLLLLLALILTGSCSAAPEPEQPPFEPDKDPDVVYVATPQNVVEMMLHLARVKRGDLVYDLGCGDGRICVAAAKTYGCRAVGYDIDPERIIESRENVKKNRLQRLVRIEQKDIFTLDLSSADVVMLYLLPELNVRLIPQLMKLKPGCRIVSHDFDMKGIKPDAVLTMWSDEDEADHEIYLWTTPLKKDPDYEEEEEEMEEDDEEMEEDEGGK